MKFVVLAVLLTCLLHPEAVVRAAALQAVKVARRSSKEHAYSGLLKKIVKQEDEICADASHVQQVRVTSALCFTLGVIISSACSCSAFSS